MWLRIIYFEQRSTGAFYHKNPNGDVEQIYSSFYNSDIYFTDLWILNIKLFLSV